MKLKAPIVTLVAGAVVAAGLLAANVVTTGGGAATVASPAVTTAPGSPPPSSPPSVRPSAPPSPSVVPSTSSAELPSPSVSAASVAGGAAISATGVATYAGTVDGGGSLAVVAKGESVIAYLCDGTNEAWLWGTTSGSSLAARNRAGDELTGARAGDTLTGSLTVNATTWTFALPSVKKPSGLYRATAKIRGADVVGGWVVLATGEQIGLLNVGGTTRPAPSIDTASGQVTVDGTVVTATEPDPQNQTR